MAGGGYLRTMWRRACARRLGRRSIVVFVLAWATVVALGASGAADAARPACAEAVLDDWTAGTLDSSHSPECYEAAIDALPEDLRAYTTAADDITRAEITASRAADENVAPRRLAGEPVAGDDSLRAFPTEVVVLGAVLAVLVSGGLAAALVRRRRER